MESRTPGRRRLFWAASLLLAQVSLLLLVITWRFFTSTPVRMQLHSWLQASTLRNYTSPIDSKYSGQVEEKTSFDLPAAPILMPSVEAGIAQEVLPDDNRQNRWLTALPSPPGQGNLDPAQVQSYLENKLFSGSPGGNWQSELVLDIKAIPAPLHPEGTLMIPALELEVELTQVPIRDGKWDISDLDSRVGWLQSTGSYPGDQLAMAFIGHGTLPPPGGAGPFMRLHRLRSGDEIQYHTADTIYIYRVERRVSIAPTEVDRLYQADGERMILITCTAWNPLMHKYERRLLLEANLVKTEKP